MTIEDVIKKLNNNPKNGLQLTKHKGLLKSTWVVYKSGKNYYYFDICEKFIFNKQHEYTENELLNEFKDSIYTIDDDLL